MNAVNADLEAWEQMYQDFKQAAKSADQRIGLLLGNGASRAVSARFHEFCGADTHTLQRWEEAPRSFPIFFS